MSARLVIPAARLTVVVQRPGEPASRQILGEAPEDTEPETAAIAVGVPADAFISGRVVPATRSQGRHWLIVALVRIERAA